MKRTLLEIAIIVVLAMAFGLGRNFLGHDPLPLFGYKPKAPAMPIVTAQFQEADIDLVRQLAMDNDTLVVDARAADLFAAGHIPAARSLPVGDFDRVYLDEEPQLRGRKMIIVYCQGGDCPDSLLLIQKLWETGWRSLFLFRGGMDEWNARGYDVEK